MSYLSPSWILLHRPTHRAVSLDRPYRTDHETRPVEQSLVGTFPFTTNPPSGTSRTHYLLPTRPVVGARWVLE